MENLTPITTNGYGNVAPISIKGYGNVAPQFTIDELQNISISDSNYYDKLKFLYGYDDNTLNSIKNRWTKDNYTVQDDNDSVSSYGTMSLKYQYKPTTNFLSYGDSELGKFASYDELINNILKSGNSNGQWDAQIQKAMDELINNKDYLRYNGRSEGEKFVANSDLPYSWLVNGLSDSNRIIKKYETGQYYDNSSYEYDWSNKVAWEYWLFLKSLKESKENLSVLDRISMGLDSVTFGILGGLASLGENINQFTRNAIFGKDESVSPTSHGSLLMKAAQDAQEQSSEGFSDVGKFFWNTGLSIVNNIVNYALAGGNPILVGVLMGTQAAGQGMYSASQKTDNFWKAFGLGVANGVFEGLFEWASFDKLTKNTLVTGLKSFVKNTAKQAAVEGSEEMFTEIANILAEAAILQNESEYAKFLDNYLKEHPEASKNKAMWALVLSCTKQIAEAGAAGAISGGVMAGTGSAVRSLTLNQRLQNAQTNYALYGESEARKSLLKLENNKASTVKNSSLNTLENDLGRLTAKKFGVDKTEAKSSVINNKNYDENRLNAIINDFADSDKINAVIVSGDAESRKQQAEAINKGINNNNVNLTALESMAKLYKSHGTNTVYVYNENDKSSGNYNPNTKTVEINLASPKNSFGSVTHEQLHYIKKANPDAYDKIVEGVEALKNNSEVINLGYEVEVDGKKTSKVTGKELWSAAENSYDFSHIDNNNELTAQQKADLKYEETLVRFAEMFLFDRSSNSSKTSVGKNIKSIWGVQELSTLQKLVKLFKSVRAAFNKLGKSESANKTKVDELVASIEEAMQNKRKEATKAKETASKPNAAIAYSSNRDGKSNGTRSSREVKQTRKGSEVVTRKSIDKEAYDTAISLKDDKLFNEFFGNMSFDELNSLIKETLEEQKQIEKELEYDLHTQTTLNKTKAEIRNDYILKLYEQGKLNELITKVVKKNPQMYQYFKNTKMNTKYDSWEKGTDNFVVMFHGTPSKDMYYFDSKKVGTNGSTMGSGFYFTESYDYAKEYGEEGKVIATLLNIEKPLSRTEQNISKDELKKFVRSVVDSNGKGYLAQFGDVNEMGYESLLNSAILSLVEHSTNDADMIEKIYRDSKIDFDKFHNGLTEVLGYDGVIAWHKSEGTQAITFRSNQAKDIFNFNPTESADIRYSTDKALSDVNINYDKATESFNSLDIRFSLDTWNNSEFVKSRDEAAEQMASALDINKQKALDYIDSVNSIAKIIANDKVRLDYVSEEGSSSFVSNSEYGGSIDFSTICKKRRLFAGTMSEVQRLLGNTPLSMEEVLEIRSMMKEKGYEVSCGLCYVEGSRTKMNEYSIKFIESYKKENPTYIPSVYETSTPEGISSLKTNHKEVYDKLMYFYNNGRLNDNDKALFAKQQKPKMYQLATAYNGEIAAKFKNKDVVKTKNINGGLRIQSFSDFEIIHLIDMMQVILDMSKVGLAGQAYTKVPDFAWALGDTNLKINCSLIAKDVKNGHLICDDVEGMPYKVAMQLRNQYSKNVGTIVVVFTDEQLYAAMSDSAIDYIIPFHKSQWNKSLYTAMGLPNGTVNYTNYQNESYIKPVYNKKGEKQKPKNYAPNQYWDFNKSGKENAETYLQLCADNNRRPKFYQLLTDNGNGSYSLKEDGSTDGYWKLLIDFKMYDNNGVGSPQIPVIPQFNMKESERMLNEYNGGHEKLPIAQDIVDEFLSKKSKQTNIRYSTDKDSEGNTLSPQQAKFFKDSKIRVKKINGWNTVSEDGSLFVVYHGTNSNDFYEFDKNKIGSSNDMGWYGKGYYFAFSKNEAAYYGKNVLSCYLNLKNPFFFIEEMQSFDGITSGDIGFDFASFVINIADKFPEIAQQLTSDYVVKYNDFGKGDVQSINFYYLSQKIKELYNSKRLEIIPISNNGKTEYGYIMRADIDNIDMPANLKQLIKEKHINSSYIAEYYRNKGEINDEQFNAINEIVFDKYNKNDLTDKFVGFSRYNSIEEAKKHRLSIVLDYIDHYIYVDIDKRMPETYMQSIGQKFRDALINKGYDGVVQSATGDEIVAFYENQIKLTSNKNPTTDKDIRYSTDKEVKPLTKTDAKNLIVSMERYAYDDKARYGIVSTEGVNSLGDMLYKTALTIEPQYYEQFGYELAWDILDNMHIEDAKVEDAKRSFNVIRKYFHRVDVSSMAKEIEYRFDKKSGKQLIWHKKDGMNVSDVYNELYDEGVVVPDVDGYYDANSGFVLVSNETDAMMALMEYADDLRNEIKEAAHREAIKEFGEERADEIAFEMSESIADWLSDFQKEYKNNAYNRAFAEVKARANSVAKKQAEKIINDAQLGIYLKEKEAERAKANAEALATKLKQQIKDNRAKTTELKNLLKQKYLVRKALDKLKELTKGKFPSATVLAESDFMGLITSLSQLRGKDYDTPRIRQIIADYKKWYNKDNVLLTNGSENVDGELAFNGQSGYLYQQTLEDIDLIADMSKAGERLNADEMSALKRILLNAYHIFTTYNMVRLGDQRIVATDYAERGVNQLSGLKPNKFVPIAAIAVEPRVVFKEMEGYAKDGIMTKLFDNVTRGETQANASHIEVADKPISQFFKDHKGYEKHYRNDKYKIGEYEIPVGVALSLMMTVKQQAGMDSVLESGFAFNDGKKTVDVKNVSSEDIKNLEKQLTDDDKAFMDLTRATLDKLGKIKEERDFDKMGYSNNVEKNYFPLKRNESGVAKNITAGDNPMNPAYYGSSQGWRQSRKQGSTLQLFIGDIQGIVLQHSKEINQYAYLAPAIEAMSRILSTNIGDANHPVSMRKELSRIWDTKPNNNGKATTGFAQYLSKLIEDIYGIKGGKSRVLSKMRGAYSTAVLGFNLKTIMTQFAAYPMAYNFLSAKAMFHAIDFKRGKGFFEEMDKYSKEALVRNYDSGIVRAEGVVDKVGKVADALTIGIQKTDRFNIGMMWVASQYEIEYTTGMKVGTEENKVEAGLLLDKIIRETQGNYTNTERNFIMRKEGLSFLQMFQSDVEKQLSRLVESARTLTFLKQEQKKNGKSEELTQRINEAGKQVAKTVTAVVIANVMIALTGLLAKHIFGKDKDEDEEERWIGFAEDLGGNFVGLIPVLGSVYNFVVNGYDMEHFAYSMLQDVADSGVKLGKVVVKAMKGEEVKDNEISIALRNSILSVSKMFGLPLQNMLNFGVGLTRRFDAESAAKYDSFFYGSKAQKKLQETDNEKEGKAIIKDILKDKGMNTSNEAVNAELYRLKDAGQDGYMPTKIGNTIKYNGKEYILSEAQYNAFSNMYSQSVGKVNNLISTNDYKQLSDEEKAKAVKTVWDAYYSRALANLTNETIVKGSMTKFFDINSYALVQAKVANMESDIVDGKTVNGSKKAKVVAYIQSLKNLTEGQKYFLIAYQGYSLNNIKGIDGTRAIRMARAYINAQSSLSTAEKKALLERCGL